MKTSRMAFMILTTAAVFSCAACSSAPAETIKNPALIKSVTVYMTDYETKEWKKEYITEYTYENGYPVSTDTFNIAADMHSAETYEYVFEDNQPVSMKKTFSEGNQTETVTYSKGKVSEILKTYNEGTAVSRTLLQYANDDPYFTLLLSSAVEKGMDESSSGACMEEADSVSVTTKNGLLEKTVNTGLYANWNEGEEKEWMRFNGTYTAEYDADGILNRTSSVFRAGPPGAENFFAVTWEDGRITEVIQSSEFPGEEAVLQAKYIFEYTDIETDPVRYAAMINAQIIGGENTFYKYFWY